MIVSVLLQRGVDKDAVDDHGNSALMHASGANGEGHPDVVETILTAGADPNIRRPVKGYSALDWASLRGLVQTIQALARHGADVNSRDEAQGLGALHKAALLDQTCSVEALIEAGADTEMNRSWVRRR